MKRVIGIDPGLTATGYGIVEKNNTDQKVITYGTLSPSPGKNLYDKLAHIYDGICQIIRQHHPEDMAVEEVFFSKNPRTALVLGQARGVILLAAAHRNLACFEYSPRKIKMSVVGNGNASKEQVKYMVQSLLMMPEAPVKFDVTDALAAALCHLNQLRNS